MKNIIDSDDIGLGGLASTAFSIGRKEFKTLGGFRQLVKSYGSEDADFFARAKREGLLFCSCDAVAYHWCFTDFKMRCKQKFLDGYTSFRYGVGDYGHPKIVANSVRGNQTKHRLLGPVWRWFLRLPLWMLLPEIVLMLCYLLPSSRSDEWIRSVLYQFKQEGIRFAKEGRVLTKNHEEI